MRIRYYPEVDALSVIFRETTVTTRELAEGIVAEYDAQDRLAGLETLDAGSRLGEPSMVREVSLEGVALAAPNSGHGAERRDDCAARKPRQGWAFNTNPKRNDTIRRVAYGGELILPEFQ